jgi:hypothetical protein
MKDGKVVMGDPFFVTVHAGRETLKTPQPA